MIQPTCPKCATPLSVTPTLGEKPANCSRCGAHFMVKLNFNASGPPTVAYRETGSSGGRAPSHGSASPSYGSSAAAAPPAHSGSPGARPSPRHGTRCTFCDADASLRPLYVHAVTTFRRGNYRVTRWVDGQADCCEECTGKALWLPRERLMYQVLLIPIGLCGGFVIGKLVGGLGFFLGGLGCVVAAGFGLGYLLHNTYAKVLGKRVYGNLCRTVGVSGWGILHPISFARSPKWGNAAPL